MFNFTLHVCNIFHMVNIDVPAGVGAPPLDAQCLDINNPQGLLYLHSVVLLVVGIEKAIDGLPAFIHRGDSCVVKLIIQWIF